MVTQAVTQTGNIICNGKHRGRIKIRKKYTMGTGIMVQLAIGKEIRHRTGMYESKTPQKGRE